MRHRRARRRRGAISVDDGNSIATFRETDQKPGFNDRDKRDTDGLEGSSAKEAESAISSSCFGDDSDNEPVELSREAKPNDINLGQAATTKYAIRRKPAFGTSPLVITDHQIVRPRVHYQPPAGNSAKSEAYEDQEDHGGTVLVIEKHIRDVALLRDDSTSFMEGALPDDDEEGGGCSRPVSSLRPVMRRRDSI